MAANSEWHYAKNNQQLGPVSSAELKQLAASGGISPSDLIWKEGMTEWKVAGTVKGLFPQPPSTPMLPLPRNSASRSHTSDVGEMMTYKLSSPIKSGTVVITRTPTLTGYFQPIQIAVDGEPAGEIGGGLIGIIDFFQRRKRTLVLCLTAGEHSVKLSGGNLSRNSKIKVSSANKHCYTTFFSEFGYLGGGLNFIDDEQPDISSQNANDAGVHVESLRRRLAAFAEKISLDSVTDLGARIKVLSSSQFPVFRLECTTLHERREAIHRQKPHDGNSIPQHRLDPHNLDVWQQSLPHPIGFDASSVEHSIAATRQAKICPACDAKGEVECDECSGEKCVQCPRCRGSRFHDCPNCNGGGHHDRLRRVQKQRLCSCSGGMLSGRICGICNGTGMQLYEDAEYDSVPCRQCKACGTVSCEYCSQTGFVQCSSCKGVGVLSCQTCQGTKQVVEFVAIVQSFEPISIIGSVPTIDCPKESVESVMGSDFREVFASSTLLTKSNIALDKFQHLSQVIAQLQNKLRTNGDHHCRPVADHVSISQAAVYRLDYSFGQKTFTAWFSGTNGPVYSPISPVTDLLMQLLEESLSAWSEGNKVEAVWTMRKVLAMTRRSEDCKKLLQPERSRIPSALIAKATTFSLSFWLQSLFADVKTTLNKWGLSTKSPSMRGHHPARNHSSAP